MTQSSSVSHSSHNAHLGRGGAAAARQPRSRAAGAPGSGPNSARRQRHDSPGLVRSTSKREVSTAGKPLTRSTSKPELHSGNKPKSVTSSVLAPKAGRAKSGLATTGGSIGVSALRALPPTVPSGLSKGGNLGKVGPNSSGASKVPVSGAAVPPPRTATPPDGLKRPVTFAPARLLDAKQLKEVVRRWYRFDKCGRMSIIEVWPPASIPAASCPPCAPTPYYL